MKDPHTYDDKIESKHLSEVLLREVFYQLSIDQQKSFIQKLNDTDKVYLQKVIQKKQPYKGTLDIHSILSDVKLDKDLRGINSKKSIEIENSKDLKNNNVIKISFDFPPTQNLKDLPSTLIENSILQFRRAKELFDQHQYHKARQILMTLENSPIYHIKIHSQVMLGRIFLNTQENDLAKQVFEDLWPISSWSYLRYEVLTYWSQALERLGLKHSSDQIKNMSSKNWSAYHDV